MSVVLRKSVVFRNVGVHRGMTSVRLIYLNF